MKLPKSPLIALLLVLALGAPSLAQEEVRPPLTEEGVMAPGAMIRGEIAKVVEVVDGDTIRVDRGQGSEPVRYIGIDTPETVHPEELTEPFGSEATAMNRSLVEGKWVILETDVSDTDQYDRLLRYVWVMSDEGLLLVNHALVAEGLAVSVSFPPDVHYADEFLSAEIEAFEAGLGMWGPDPNEATGEEPPNGGS